METDLMYADLKKRVDHLQYDEINPMKEELGDIRIALSGNDILTKQTVESNKKLSETLDSIKETMRDISQGLKDENTIVKNLTDTVAELNTKVNSTNEKMDDKFAKVNEKIASIDDKGKIDIVLILKQWALNIIGVGGIIYTIVMQLMNK